MIQIITNSLNEYNDAAHKKFVKFRKDTENVTTQKRFYMSTYGYENSHRYIIRQDDKLIKSDQWDKFELENIVAWWKKKASKRYENIKSEGRLRTELEVWRKDNIDSIDIIR